MRTHATGETCRTCGWEGWRAYGLTLADTPIEIANWKGSSVLFPLWKRGIGGFLSQ